MSENNKGTNNPMFGKHLSEATRQKLSLAKQIWWANRKVNEHKTL